ncbi:MAG TPA: RtcB family protein [bacterium]|nr:RtcB family protein [bacterium]
MKIRNVSGGVPLYLYIEDLEAGALEQAENCARLPFVFHHIAVMPDAHQGYAMPIGGVMACRDYVVPYAVGVDIGCGMLAVRTSLKAHEVQGDLENLINEGFRQIPIGFEWHKKPQSAELFSVWDEGKNKKLRSVRDGLPVVTEHLDEVRKQMGTLGGGNHFIEIQVDQEGHVWLMLHSGSRNIGHKVASHYHKRAQEYVKSKNIRVGKDYSYLPVSHEDGQRYLDEMDFCVRFAFENRDQMRAVMLDTLREVLRKDFHVLEDVRTAHNYASWEEHYGEKVLVHRKGAVRAREGEMVTIPGSMGTASYIARGKGAPESFQSCSHGAGRSMGRRQALKAISREEFEHQMGNVVLGCAKIKDAIQEAPAAYKDIDDVMRQQADLVEVVYRLTPLAVLKG